MSELLVHTLALVIFFQFIVIVALILYGAWIRNKDQETFCKALIALKNNSLEILQECIKSAQYNMPAVVTEEEEDEDNFSID